jgi:hypothetical protein
MNMHAYVSHRLFVAALSQDTPSVIDARLKRALVIGSVVLAPELNGRNGSGQMTSRMPLMLSNGRNAGRG